MIVNPQLFNYKLIIGTLVIAIVVLGSYSFSSYNTLKNNQEFIKQETQLVKNELSEMINHFDNETIENEAISLQLAQSKSKFQNLLDSVTTVKSNVSLISRYRTQIAVLSKQRKKLLAQLALVSKKNQLLVDHTNTASNKLKTQSKSLVSLQQKNKKLALTLKDAGALKAKNIIVTPLKTSSRSVYETHRISSVDHIEVCLDLFSNQFTPRGSKNIYFQIIDSKNRIISDKGSKHFKDFDLDYSGKTRVNNLQGKINVCAKISVDNKKLKNRGTYYISVFHDSNLLGSTTIELN